MRACRCCPSYRGFELVTFCFGHRLAHLGHFLQQRVSRNADMRGRSAPDGYKGQRGTREGQDQQRRPQNKNHDGATWAENLHDIVVIANHS